MSTKRELVTNLRAHRAGLIAKREEIDTELVGIEAALEALNGDRRMTPRTRAAHGARVEQTLEHLRRNPDASFSPAELASDTGMPVPSATTAVKNLTRDGLVHQVDETKQGIPIIKHKPTTIKPGEGVVE